MLPFRPIFSLLSVVVISAVWGQTPSPAPRQRSSRGVAPVSSVNESAANKPYGNVPLFFEENAGQTDRTVRFVSRGPGYTLFLGPSEAVLALRPPIHDDKRNRLQKRRLFQKSAPQKSAATFIRMKMSGANLGAEVTGLQQLPGVVNYLLGKNPEKWHKGVRTYSTVQYSDIYPNVDLVYYGNQRQLEYDFILKSGADPKQISLGFEGAQPPSITASGDVAIATPAGTLTMKKPNIYQMENGARKRVEGQYELRSDHNIGINVKSYDPAKPLVIDPVLVYSTYLGGSDNVAEGIAVDAQGDSYLVGITDFDDYPTT